MEAIDAKALVLALGPAGTGKTYLAIAKAVEALESGTGGAHRALAARRWRPASRSASCPARWRTSSRPTCGPLYDALSDRLSMKRVRALMAEGAIEIAPVGFMRGRTLNNAFVVIDEAQNCTYVQLKMLLTRLGWSSTMVITGDPNQSDLLPELSGLATVAARLEAVATSRSCASPTPTSCATRWWARCWRCSEQIRRVPPHDGEGGKGRVVRPACRPPRWCGA